MRKIAKLLALTLAFAMVMSVMVMPVSAEVAESSYVAPTGVNLFEEWGFEPYDCEGTDTTKTWGLYGSADPHKNPMFAYGCTNRSGSTGTITVTDGKGTDGTKGGVVDLTWGTDYIAFAVTNVPMEPGVRYVLSADVKINGGTATTATLDDYAYGSVATNYVQAEILDENLTINNETFTNVSYSFNTSVLTPLDSAKRRHFQLGFKLPRSYSSSVTSLVFDNFSLVKYEIPEEDYPLPDDSRTAMLHDNNAFSAGTAITAVDGVYTIPVVETATNGSGCFGKTWIFYEPGKTYYVTAEVKDGTPDNATTPQVTNSRSISPKTSVTLENNEGFRVSTADWTRVGYRLITSDETSTEYRGHFGFNYTGRNTDALLVRNFKVFEISAFTAAASMASTTNVDPADAKVTVTFSKAPAEFAKANVSVNNGATVASVDRVSDKVYTVTLSNLAKGNKSYTVAVSGVKDVYGQEAASSSVSFSTISYTGEVLADNDIDGDFNTIYSDLGAGNNATFAQDELDGEKVLKVTSTANGNPSIRINNLKNNIDNTAKYIVTYKVKKAVDSNVTAVDIWASQSMVPTNLRYPSARVTAPHAISDTEWTDVTGFIDVTEYAKENDSIKLNEARNQYNNVMKAQFSDVSNKDASGNTLTSEAYKAALDAAYEAAYAAADETVKAELATVKANAQAKYDAVMDSSKWTEGPMHIGFNVKGAGVVYIDKVEVRKATALDLSAADFARVIADSDSVSVAMTSNEAKTVYVAAAKYDGDKMTDIKFDKAVINANAVSVNLNDIDDTYTLFIWDSELNPLSSAKLISEF